MSAVPKTDAVEIPNWEYRLVQFRTAYQDCSEADHRPWHDFLRRIEGRRARRVVQGHGAIPVRKPRGAGIEYSKSSTSTWTIRVVALLRAHPTAEWTAQQLREAFPFEQTPSVYASGSRRHLRRRVLERCKSHGNRGSTVSTAMPVAASLRGARDRHDSPRVPRHVIVFNEAGCTAKRIRDLLSRIQDAPLAGQGYAGLAARAPAGTWSGCCHTASWRSSPPLRAARSLSSSPRRSSYPATGESILADRSRHDCLVLQSQREFLPILPRSAKSGLISGLQP